MNRALSFFIFLVFMNVSGCNVPSAQTKYIEVEKEVEKEVVKEGGVSSSVAIQTGNYNIIFSGFSYHHLADDSFGGFEDYSSKKQVKLPFNTPTGFTQEKYFEFQVRDKDNRTVIAKSEAGNIKSDDGKLTITASSSDEDIVKVRGYRGTHDDGYYFPENQISFEISNNKGNPPVGSKANIIIEFKDDTGKITKETFEVEITT